ncbi:hypothetical protein ACFVHI_01520 [Kitasatospora sp. NPDC127121]
MLTSYEEIMRDVCTDFEAKLRQFNSAQDHVQTCRPGQQRCSR